MKSKKKKKKKRLDRMFWEKLGDQRISSDVTHPTEWEDRIYHFKNLQNYEQAFCEYRRNNAQ